MRLTPFRLTLLYAGVGGLWISFSDGVLLSLAASAEQLSWLQTAKGYVWIAVTAVLFYVLVRRHASSTSELAAAARSNEAHLERVLETVPEGIAIIDPLGRIERVNAAAERILGLPRDVLRGREYDASSCGLTTVDGEPFARDDLPAGVVLRTGAEVHDVEVAVKCGTGERQVLRVSAAPLRDERRELVGTVTVFTDVTAARGAERARLEAERARREVERLSRLIADTIDDVIWLTDLDGRVDYISPAFTRLAGYAPEELIGTSLFEAFTPGSRAAAVDSVGAALARFAAGDTVEPFTVELEMACKTGGGFMSESRVGFLRDESGQPLALAGVTRDITERRRLHAQLLQAQKMEAIGHLAGGVAHDFNNLLSVIMSYVSFVSRRLPADHEAQPDVDEIAKAAQRGSALTRQLLAFGRRSHGRPQVLDLNRVITDIDGLLERTLGERVTVETRLAGDLWLVRADQGQMEQVIMNLAVNARDAMPVGGRIVFETANVQVGAAHARHYAGLVPGSYVMERITDTGIGMSPEVMARIFEPFFSTKDKAIATGLGLSTVFGIVRQAGGHIYVDSAVGKGTSFTIFLPANRDGAAAAPGPRLLGGGETILVVEDDDAVRSVATRLLHERGYKVLQAPDGDAALVASRQHSGPIHLVLSDVVMPGMSGPEMVAHLQDSRPQVKVIFMSGYAGDELAQTALSNANAGWLDKPLSGERLLQYVREVLDGAA